MPEKEPRFHGEVTEKSHKNMSRIHGKDTRIEIVMRKALWSRGFRYRKNYKAIFDFISQRWLCLLISFLLFRQIMF